MALLAYPFLVLAVTGFVAVLIVHVAALLGLIYPFEVLLKFLFPGLVVVWLPTVLVMTHFTRDVKQKLCHDDE